MCRGYVESDIHASDCPAAAAAAIAATSVTSVVMETYDDDVTSGSRLSYSSEELLPERDDPGCWDDAQLPSNAPSPIDRAKIEQFLERNNGDLKSYLEEVIRKAEFEDSELEKKERKRRQKESASLSPARPTPQLLSATPSPPPAPHSTTSKVEAMVHKPFEPPVLGKTSR